MAPHTPNLAFSFLACACALLGWLRTRQILLFLFWRVPVPCWGWLRTRQILPFLFWRVPVPCWGVLRTRQILPFLFWRVPVPCWGAPHTPNLAFSFLACAYSLRLRQQAAMVTPPRFARRQIVGAIRDKNFVLVSKPPW